MLKKCQMLNGKLKAKSRYKNAKLITLLKTLATGRANGDEPKPL